MPRNLNLKDNVHITICEKGCDPLELSTHNMVTNIGKSSMVAAMSGYTPVWILGNFYVSSNGSATNPSTTTIPTTSYNAGSINAGYGPPIDPYFAFSLSESQANGITLRDVVMGVNVGTEVMFARATYSAIEKNGLITVIYTWDFDWGES